MMRVKCRTCGLETNATQVIGSGVQYDLVVQECAFVREPSQANEKYRHASRCPHMEADAENAFEEEPLTFSSGVRRFCSGVVPWCRGAAIMRLIGWSRRRVASSSR